MPPPTINLPSFIAAIAAHDQRRHAVLPGFVHRRARSSVGQACPLCKHPYDLAKPLGFNAPVLATIVHPALGGPLTADNTFTCCRRCQQQRASSDLLTSVPPQDGLLTRRAAILLSSDNHLLPLSVATRSADFIKALAKRHEWPRSRVFAAQGEDGLCFLGVSPRFGDGPSKGLARLLARQAGHSVHDATHLTVFRLDDNAFRGLVWKLIDANNLVIALACRSTLRDFRDCWWPTSTSPSALRLRQVGVTVPDPVSSQRIPVTKADPLRPRRQDRQPLEAELRLARHKATALQQAINDQHKGHWLDGQEGDGETDTALLRELDATSRQVDELRTRLLRCVGNPVNFVHSNLHP